MSYTANQYNYGTPLSSAVGLTDASSIVSDIKYFTLFDNTLDGSYYPISGSVGLWGASMADDTGSLAEPFVVTVEEELSLNAISLVGSAYSYPVEFTIDFYNGDELLYTLAENDNNLPAYLGVLPDTYDVTKYVITINRISSAGVARLYNSYKAYYVHSYDTLPVLQVVSKALNVSATGTDTLFVNASDAAAMTGIVSASDSLPLKYIATTSIHNTIDKASDSLVVPFKDKSHILNTFDKKFDTLPFNAIEDISHVIKNMWSGDELLVGATDHCNAELYNIHRAMKEPTRQIYGKVYITYTDPMTEATITSIEVSDEAYNSNKEQITDGVGIAEGRYFTLYDNDLSGSYVVSSANSQTGWTSKTVSNEEGRFENPPTMKLSFAAKPIKQLTLHFDASHECIVTDFIVLFTSQNGNITARSITDNMDSEVLIYFDEVLADVVSIELTVTGLSKPYYPVNLLDIPAVSTFLYTGYQDNSSLISISLLEELTYEDDIEALGGVSANEIDVSLDNSNREFNFDNLKSAIATQLKRNRKIEPWLGAEVSPGHIEWYKLGVFWSYNWNVPYNSLTASVIGFDTIGLLDTSYFSHHQVLMNKSLGELIDYVLTDAKRTLNFLEWEVAEELYYVFVPYAWFSLGSHTAALRKISLAYPMHIYCNRDGKIIAAPQKLKLDYYNDVWSDSTNVIEKTYESLYTVLPNIINVKVVSPVLEQNKELVKDELMFDVSDINQRVLNFSEPYVSDIVVTIDCDNTVNYTYNVYSWGIEIDFTGNGYVRSIVCNGTSLNTSNTTVLTHRDNESILLNGAVTRDISADFIQTSSLASTIINRIASLSEDDKYDAEVTYRGDIALSINDPILLLDGIAPDNRYNIKRHQLTWDGALTGKATLNT